MNNLQSRCLSSYAVLSVKGPHHENEDRYVVEMVKPKNQNNYDNKNMSYYAVYDGHGGNYVVDYIKEHLHKNILSEIERNFTKMSEEETYSSSDSQLVDGVGESEIKEEEESVIYAMRQGFKLTDEKVIDACRKANDWSGSCVCATLIRGNVLYLANLGDSTAVIFQFGDRPGTISQSVVLSKTHKPKMEEERIDAAGGWVSADGYILGVLSCSRALGDREMKHYEDFEKSHLKKEFEVGKERLQKLIQNQGGRARSAPRLRRKQSIPKSNMKFLVSNTPDIDVFILDPSDALLVIGSDGLWDFLAPKRAVELVNEAYSRKRSLDDVCEALVHAAQKAKSSDDITVMVINLQKR
jgi:serine/threonine protein phosphatase PrpC